MRHEEIAISKILFLYQSYTYGIYSVWRVLGCKAGKFLCFWHGLDRAREIVGWRSAHRCVGKRKCTTQVGKGGGESKEKYKTKTGCVCS